MNKQEIAPLQIQLVEPDVPEVLESRLNVIRDQWSLRLKSLEGRLN